MRHYHILVAGLLSLAALGPSAVRACSVVSDYRVPTNLELAGQAELILLARVEGEAEGGEDIWDRSLIVAPIIALKGELPSGPVDLPGNMLAERPDERGFALLSNPFELEQAHPLAFIGGCHRYIFPKGTTVLFFLDRREGEWVRAGRPFSRTAEDVLSDDAPWLRLTRFYVDVAAAPEAEREALLRAEAARLSAMADDPVAQLMAADIARQLAGPNDTWNAIMHRAISGEQPVAGPAAAEVAAEAVAGLVSRDPDTAIEQPECDTEDTGIVCTVAVNDDGPQPAATAD